ncbi:carbonic anhydrase 1 [Halyomorpha halys]|uniref:carbonic anhydrase 1 n=1 Tax=Halyomorpha halys TaxID=286706 RepID=UPI0034D3406E
MHHNDDTTIFRFREELYLFGNGVKVTPDPSVRIAISGGGLRGNYVLQSAHFHFGSEHLIDSKRSALEAHLVHYREIYGDKTDAASNDPEGIAVLGTLFCESRVNDNLQKVLQGANGPQFKLTFRDFLPNNLDFYRYQGSLTTPPCSEAVVWTVFKNSLPISTEQIETIKGAFPNVESTYRNVKPLNGRIVERWSRSGLKNKLDSFKSSFNSIFG